MYIGLSTLAVATTFFVLFCIDSDMSEIFDLTGAGPILTLIAAIPVYLARAFRGWTVAHRSSQAVPRPMSLASCLTTMAVLGVAFTATKLYPWDEIAMDAEEATVYLLLFGGSPIACGLLHLWLLPTILKPHRETPISWKQWLLLGSFFVLPSLASAGGFAVLAVVDSS
jgi:hypothetical protein